MQKYGNQTQGVTAEIHSKPSIPPMQDLFATVDNTTCLDFCSTGVMSPDLLLEAFLLWWPWGLLYVFLQIPLILRIISKINEDKSLNVMIAPYRLRQCLPLDPLQMSKQSSMCLPAFPNVILQNTLHLDPQLYLMAWMLASQATLTEAASCNFRKFFYKAGSLPPGRCTPP